jgi:hypothetical protein
MPRCRNWRTLACGRPAARRRAKTVDVVARLVAELLPQQHCFDSQLLGA